MYARPGYAQRTPKAISKVTFPVLPLIHEELTQDIQGGSPGEHFHLTAEQHAWVADNKANGILQYEPVAVNGELLFDEATGDVLMNQGELYVA